MYLWNKKAAFIYGQKVVSRVLPWVRYLQVLMGTVDEGPTEEPLC